MSIDLTSIPQLARNLNRVIEIAGVLAKYGLADWIDRLDARFLKRWVKHTSVETLSEVSREARIRLALTELGTTFIKLGQMLSTRRDMVGPKLADELSKLQADVPADDYEVTKSTIEAELGKPVEQLFVRFDPAPLASASIGQAHRARLEDGREAIVKIQHPKIIDRVSTDLDILFTLAGLAEEYFHETRAYRPTNVVTDFRRQLLRELDFRRELRHLQIFRRNFATDSTVSFPEPIPELSSSKVLTMTYLVGTPLGKLTSTLAIDADGNELARRGACVYLDMIFRDGFYHADPHPGNLLVLPGGVLGLLDGGMVGRVDDRMRSLIQQGMIAVLRNDAAELTELIMQVGEVPPHLDTASLQCEVADQLSFYWGMPLDQFQLGGALDDLTEAIRRYQISLPASLALLLKVLIMLEGTARLLSPHFNLAEVLEPYRRQFIRRQFSPRRLLRRVLTNLSEWEEVLNGLPRLTRDMMQFARRQRFAVQLQHQHLEPSVNRLVFGMMTSALFVGSSFLWAYSAPPTLAGVSVFGILGCVTSTALGYRLFRAIQHSGKLEDD